MVYILILIVTLILIFPGRWYIIFIINKGKVKLNIDDNIDDLDLTSEYPELKQTKDDRKLKKIYREIILCKIIPSFFEIIFKNKTNLMQNDFKKEYDEFEVEYNMLTNYKEKNNYWLKKIFKETGRIAYKDFQYDFDFMCTINNKCINIIRITNYFYMQGDNSLDTGRKY